MEEKMEKRIQWIKSNNIQNLLKNHHLPTVSLNQLPLLPIAQSKKKTTNSNSPMILRNQIANSPVISFRTPQKGKNSQSAASILASKVNVGNCYLNFMKDGQSTKKSVAKISKEQSYTLAKSTKTQSIEEEESSGRGEKSYFLRCLDRKDKLRKQMNINIHNSIFTFKEFFKLCQVVNPKSPDQKLAAEIQGRKTVVFDMDETLIHTNQTSTQHYEIKVPFRSYQGKVGFGYVEVRPHAKELLKRLSKHFDVIIFTASTQAYADPIIDHLDPDRIVQHRFYRESCTLIRNQFFVKDLRVLGRKLENVILVDNAPYSYMMQLENGVPILPFYKGKDDDQLLHLQEYIMSLKDVPDVRPINSSHFKLHEYIKFDSHEKLISKLYSDWVK